MKVKIRRPEVHEARFPGRFMVKKVKRKRTLTEGVAQALRVIDVQRRCFFTIRRGTSVPFAANLHPHKKLYLL